MKRIGALLAIGMIHTAAHSQSARVQESFEQPSYKSKGTAYILSFLGTGVPLLLSAQISASTHGGSEGWVGGIALGGALLGPSLGQFYAGSYSGGWLAAGIRTGGLFVTSLGLSQFAEQLFCPMDDESECDDGVTAVPLLLAGSVTFLGGAIYSFINAGRTVDRYNDTQSRLGLIEWSPFLTTAPQGGMRTGVLAYLRF